MRLLLLGATGRTGKHILNYALSLNYKVNCLVRYPKKLEAQNGLTIFKGNPINSTDLEKAIQGCSFIISTLNISRTSDFPWSKLRTPKNYLSEVMKCIIIQAKNTPIKRIVLCSAWGVSETRDNIPFWFRWTIDYSNIRHAYLDHEKQEKILESSNLNWTIVRPVGLTNFNKQLRAKESINNNPKPSLLVSRKAVATFMVNALLEEKLIREKVVISMD